MASMKTEKLSEILRVVAFELPPFTMRFSSYNRTEVVAKGVAIKTLNAILNILSINYTVAFRDGTSGILLPNGSWTGALGTLQGNEFDIVATPIFPSAVRLQAVDFSVGVLFSESYIFGGMPPQEMPNIGVIIKTFDEKIWSITLTFMFLLVLLSGVQVVSRSDRVVVLPVNKKEFYRLLSAYSAALFMEGTPRDPLTARGRFLFGIWWLVMLVLANGFCGHSRSMMMMPREGLKVRDLDHLASLLHIVKPITVKGGFYDSFFRSGSYNNRKIYEAMDLSADSNGMFSKNYLLLLKEGKAVTLYDATVTRRALENLCKQFQIDNIYYSGPFYATEASWSVRKDINNKLKKNINNRIRRLQEGYIINKWIEEETRNFWQCLAGDTEAASEKALSFNEMNTLFFLLCGCLFASSLSLLIEMVLYYGFKV